MNEEIPRLIQDIEQEVAYTRDLIGKDALDPRVMAAMADVPRHDFVPGELRHQAYINAPLPIGAGQTISQPYIVALMTDLLQVGADAVVLEVGTGSGYQAAILSRVVKQVYSLEIIESLALAAEARLQSLGYDNVESRSGDGYEGWPEHAPYDGIIVTAAASQVPPPLVAQLKPGARLVIPVQSSFMGQDLRVITRHEDGKISSRDILSVVFVPLTRGKK